MKDLGRTEKELYDSPVSPSTQIGRSIEGL